MVALAAALDEAHGLCGGPPQSRLSVGVLVAFLTAQLKDEGEADADDEQDQPKQQGGIGVQDDLPPEAAGILRGDALH